MPAITSGSTEEAERGAARHGHDVLDRQAARACSAACVSSWATIGLAAEAVSTLPPAGVATNAP